MIELGDLVGLDRRIARAHGAIEREVRRLSSSKEAEPAGDAKAFREDFAGIRDLAGQSTFGSLRDLSAGAAVEPHRAGLLRWVFELLELRVAWDLVVDEAEAMRAVDPTLSR